MSGRTSSGYQATRGQGSSTLVGFWAMRRLFSRQNDCGGAVSEEPARDKIRHRVVVLLPGKRTEFDGEQKRVLFRKGTHVIGGAGDSRRPGNAAEAKDRGALDVLCGSPSG